MDYWLCELYLAVCPFPEPVRSEQSELSVSPVPSPARRSSEWPRHWPQMKPGGPLCPCAGLVEISVEVKGSAEDEVDGIGTQIPPASPTCYSYNHIRYDSQNNVSRSYSPQWLWTVLNLNWMPLSPGVAIVVFILLFLPVYPGNVSQRGHKAVLPSSTDEDTSILTVWIKLPQKEKRSLTFWWEYTHTWHLTLLPFDTIAEPKKEKVENSYAEGGFLYKLT